MLSEKELIDLLSKEMAAIDNHLIIVNRLISTARPTIETLAKRLGSDEPLLLAETVKVTTTEPVVVPLNIEGASSVQTIDESGNPTETLLGVAAIMTSDSEVALGTSTESSIEAATPKKEDVDRLVHYAKDLTLKALRQKAEESIDQIMHMNPEQIPLEAHSQSPLPAEPDPRTKELVLKYFSPRVTLGARGKIYPSEPIMRFKRDLTEARPDELYSALSGFYQNDKDHSMQFLLNDYRDSIRNISPILILNLNTPCPVIQIVKENTRTETLPGSKYYLESHYSDMECKLIDILLAEVSQSME